MYCVTDILLHVNPSASKMYPASQKQYSEPPELTPHCWVQLNVVFVQTVFAKEENIIKFIH